jgi:TolA-binding protein
MSRLLDDSTRGGRTAPAALLVLAALVAPAAARAQVPTLDRVDSLVVAGDYSAARSTLDRWWSARDQFDVPGSDKARALMLRAQLAPDAETAEPDYMAVVLGYPTSDHAPEALLRLGQGLLATGEAARSAAYLERLTADYPGWSRRPLALLWLARANTAARRSAAACNAARTGLRDTRDPDLSAMLRVEAGASCAIGEQAGQAETAPSRPAPEAAPAPPRRAEPAPAPAGRGDFTVQSGAFRYQKSADALMARLREAGFEPRLVRVPRNDLMRVRVGRFTDVDQARALVSRLRGLSFEAIVVRDAAQERRP